MMRSDRSKSLSLVLAMVFACMGIANAEDNTTTVYDDGSSVNLGANLVIGDTGTNNILIITNATKVRNNLGVLGNQTGADYNFALVSGTGSIWSNIVSGAPALLVGATGSYNQVVVTNGGRLVTAGSATSQGVIGRSLSSSNNSVIVTGTNSSWLATGRISLGAGPSNALIISDGALVSSTAQVIMGDDTTGSPAAPGNNLILVTGSNSTLNVGDAGTAASQRVLLVGRLTGHNQLIITNGGQVNSFDVVFGSESFNYSSTNLAVVTGANSRWNVNGNVSIQRLHSELRVENGGLMTVTSNILIGAGTGIVATNSLLNVKGGTLVVTNAGGTASLNVVRGTNLISSGTITTDRLLATNGVASRLVFNGGSINTKSTSVSNAVALVVGDGASAATLNLLDGTHSFFNGLRITNNATLKGTGTIVGDTTVHGTLAPGASPGLLSITGNLTLASNSTFEVEINGTTPGSLYDQVDVTGAVDLSASVLDITVGFAPAISNTFMIINNDDTDAVAGTFLGLAENAFIDASSGGNDAFFRISYMGGTGNDVVLIATIPEPSILCLLGLGVLLLRRKRNG